MGRGVKPQIVEILAPDDDSPAGWAGLQPGDVGGATSARSATGRRRMWIVGGAACALAAVVVGVSVTSGGPDSRAVAPPTLPATSAVATSPTTTSAGPNGGVTTSGRIIFPSAVKVVPDTPVGFRVAGAGEFYPFRATESGARQLWADTADGTSVASAAERRTGPTAPPWFEIDASTDPADGRTGLARVQGRNGVITVVNAASGWISVVGAIDGGSAFVSGAGVGLAEAIAVLDTARLRDHVLRIDPVGVPSAFTLVATTERNIGAQGTASRSNVLATTISYYGSADSSQWIQLTAGAARPTFDATALEFRLRDRAVADLGDGRSAETYTSADPDRPERFVLTHVGGVPVEITGNAPLEVLVELARSARIVSDGSWIILQHQAHDEAAPITSDGPVQWQLLASGMLSDATTPWSLNEIDLPGTSRPSYAAQAGADGTSFSETRPAPTVQIAALATVSIVIARMPHDEPGAVLEVTIGGATHVAQIVAAGDGVPDLVGVVTFEELGIPTAQIVDAAGRVRAQGPVVAP